MTRAQRGARYACVVLAACSWGTWPLILRRADAIAPMDPAVTSTIVMGVITLVGFAMTLRDRAPGRASVRAWGGMAILGVADALNILLLFWAYRVTSVAIAVLTHYLTPIFVAVAAPLVLRERMTLRTAAAIATSFAGLALMLAPSVGAGGSASVWLSAMLGAGSAVFYASNVIVNKFVAADFSTSETMFWHGVVGTPLLAAFVPPAAWSAVDPRAAGFLALATVGPGALAGLAFVWGLRRMPAAHASTLTLLEPLVSILLGTALLGEWLGMRAVGGGGLILAGAVVVMSAPAATSASSARTPGSPRR